MDRLATAFGQVLKTARLQAGLTQEQLGFDAGVQRKFISQLELGQKSPSLETVIKVSVALGVPPGAFVTLVVSALDDLAP